MINENEIARSYAERWMDTSAISTGKSPPPSTTWSSAAWKSRSSKWCSPAWAATRRSAAELLGMNRNTLRKKIKVYGIKYGIK